MRCFEVKDILQENITSGGIELDSELRSHLDSCAGCREFLRELEQLSEGLLPLADFRLTPAEEAGLEEMLDARLDSEPAPIPTQPREHKIFSIARIAMAAAAVLVLVVLSSGPTRDNETAAVDDSVFIQYSMLDETDVASLIADDSEDLLPSLFDQSSAAYLASQLRPGQVDEILGTVSDEEMEWLEKNFSVEI